MPHYEFLWNDEPGGNTDKCARHGLNKDDVEHVVMNPVHRKRAKRSGRSRSSGRPIAEGLTLDRRYIVVVYEMVDPVTVNVVTVFELQE